MSEQEKKLGDGIEQLAKSFEAQSAGELMSEFNPLTAEETLKKIQRDVHETSENTLLEYDKKIQELTKNSKKITIQDEAERVELNRQRFNKISKAFSPVNMVNQGKSTFDLLEMLGVKKSSQQARPEQREANIDNMAKEEDKEMAQAKQKREGHQDKLVKQNTVSAKAAQEAIIASDNEDSAKEAVAANSATPFQAPTPQPPSK